MTLFCRMLDALSRRTEKGNVKGIILVDGQKPPSTYKFKTGYVVQVTTAILMMTVVAVVYSSNNSAVKRDD